jgi:DNA-binding transcriptional ArsR family regulator
METKQMDTTTPTERLTIMALWHANPLQPMDYARLAMATGATPSTMESTLRKLRKANVVTSYRCGRRSFFELVDPAGWTGYYDVRDLIAPAAPAQTEVL